MGWFDTILRPIMWLVAWIMYGSHKFFTLLFGQGSGLAWILAIVMLVVVMRVIMIPLFVKQIRSSRSMQLLQPDLQKLQKKYKGKTDPISKRRQQEEMMALYREHGANPFSSCLPILAQSPFFFALFRVLYSLKALAEGTYAHGDAIGPITQEVAKQIESVTLFGAPLSATFMNKATWVTADGFQANEVTVRIVTVILIILMSVTVFTTQRQLTMKNMPQSAMDNPMFRTQKIMLYAMPGVFAVSGVNFPIGVLIYWLTTNIWSMGQQFFVIRRMPQPGSEAEQKLKERQAKKRAKKGLPEEVPEINEVPEPPRGGQRLQPKKTSRAERRSGKPEETSKPGGESTQSASPSPSAQDAAASGSGPVNPSTANQRAKAKPGSSARDANQPTKPKAKGHTAGSSGPAKSAAGQVKPSGSGKEAVSLAEFGRGTTGPDTSTGSNGGRSGARTPIKGKGGGQRPQPKKSSRKKRK